MKRLSLPRETIKDHYDVIVVGSGYGGGVAASRVARAGQQVCVIERGKEVLPGDYPDTAIKLAKQVQTDFPDKHVGVTTALFDLRYNKDINVIIGCGLGGTSLINANINEAPDARIYQDKIWPVEIREDASNGELEKFTAYADDMLKPGHYPEHYPELDKEAVFKKSSQEIQGQLYTAKINVNFESGPNHVGVEQQACVNCGDCMSGCNYSAKNTVLMNYLPDAKNFGAEIFTQLQVDFIERDAETWQVHLHPTASDLDNKQVVQADIVILAAGTLGSSEILLRSREQGLTLSDCLGKRFSGNGDMLGISYNTDQSVNAVGFGFRSVKGRRPVGPTSTVLLDTRNNNSLENSNVLASASIPGALAALLAKALASLATVTGQDSDKGWWHKQQQKLRKAKSLLFGAYTGAVKNTQFILSVSQDDSAGQLYLKNNRIRVHWPDAGKDSSLAVANTTMKQMTKPLAGTYIQNPVWNNLTDQSLITGHPLGGCVMADTAEHGVVNHKGQVFSSSRGKQGHQGLYVMDGAVIPRSLGINPLNAITTIAERSCYYLIQDYGWTINYELPSRKSTNV